MTEETGRAWAEIDLGALEHNYHTLRAMTAPGCRFLGVVKADAYGHGAVPVARRLEALGADYLAVACLDEAVELRRAGVAAPILIFGATPPELAHRLVEHGLTQTVFSLEYGEALSAALGGGDKLTVHVKVDTGMSRLGFLGKTAPAEIAALCALPNLDCQGIFTHFADADGSEEYTMGQFVTFLDVVDELKKQGVEFEIRHCAASAAVLHYPCTHLDMIRPGIALYGHYPDRASEGLDGPGLAPVMTLKARVASVKTVPAGTPVSYGRTATLGRDSRLAVLSVGYGDGLPRLLSGDCEALIGGRQAPIVGRICMDLCMADVTGLEEVRPGDEAVLFGAQLPLEEKADKVGTISYELLCAVSRRVPRVYRD